MVKTLFWPGVVNHHPRLPLANLGLVTLLGDAPTGTMPEDEDEMRCLRRSLRGKLTPSALLNLGGSYNL